ncbi:peptidoglycan editing factor PgeF [Epibacterium sp. Ofav1-8]|uniref:peptidoglycan editing factor PgeF n=1 Tax=Epibacterium sp. Ofav1-8 TaxID=2917735 RepID=UPI001EF54FA3|nr:peptidoglycan editing factor PgeF [Epibacterium sp. Ofav1-8]MCG7622875.1 peptidoglycan editing factor PgeF [Epibacterium sp. Ofav1-8]
MTLESVTSDLLAPVAHGFFTRKGGASSGVFAGLNCGVGSSDQREAVMLNRARVAAAMAAPTDALLGMHQVHSADVAVVDGLPEDPDAPRPRADAMVTATPGVVLSVLTADCQPVLFADPEAGVIGAAHAGWRGTLDGVLEATVEAMLALGASRANLRAVIGPTISQRAYEVGPDFFDDFMMQDPANGRFFAQGQGDRMQFDLPGLGLARLRAAGIDHCAWTRHCTYSDPERFYSYRRSTHAKEADYGRLISCIRL